MSKPPPRPSNAEIAATMKKRNGKYLKGDYLFSGGRTFYIDDNGKMVKAPPPAADTKKVSDYLKAHD
jgi:hypothetical protein